MSRSFTGYPSVDQALSGFSAGMVSTVLLHPLDLIKIRFQVDDSVRSGTRPLIGGTIRAFNQIRQSDGWSGLYRGLSANMAGAMASWGLYFYFYSLIKDWMPKDANNKLSATQHLVASAEAGAITALFTNPFWVIKTRMCITTKRQLGAYKGLIDGLTQLWKYEGTKGLYKGMVPAMFGVSHGAFQFMAYEEMKKWRKDLRSEADRDNLSNLEYITMAGSSKTFAVIVTYPYQVIRSRLQIQKDSTDTKYKGSIDMISKIYKSEGLGGFYKGLAPNIIRVLPGTCITFLVYENMSWFFREYGTFKV